MTSACAPNSNGGTGIAFLSPLAPGAATIFNLTAGGIAQHLTDTYQKGDDSPYTIQAVQQVTADETTKSIYLIVYSDDSVSKVGAPAVALTDEPYVVGQTVSNIWNFIAAQNGTSGEFQFEARLLPPSDVDQQYIVAYPLADFTSNPSFQDLVKMADTLTFSS